MLLEIGQIKVNERIRKDFGNIDELADDIKSNGLINPPVVTPNYELIAGERRLRACKHLGFQQIEVRVMTVKDYEHQLRLEISENENRKEFTFSERVAWARRLERVESAKAHERMVKPTQNSSEGETAEIVARDAGFGSKDTYRKAKFLSDNADADAIARLDAGESSINREYEALKRKLATAERERDEAIKQAQSIMERDRQLHDENEKLKREKNPEPQVIEKVVEVTPSDYDDTLRKNQEMNTKIARLSGEMETIRRTYESKLRDVQDGDVKANKRELQRLLSEQLKAIGWNHSSALFIFQRIAGQPEATATVRQFMNEYQETVRKQLNDWQNALTLNFEEEEEWETI